MSLRLVNMFVRSGMHEVAVAGHIRAAGLDDPIPVVRQRQSFEPLHFRKKKKKKKPHSCLLACRSTINSQLKAAPRERMFLTILTYCCRAYSMCQYRQHSSHYVSCTESLARYRFKKKRRRENTFLLSEGTSVWFGSSLYLD